MTRIPGIGECKATVSLCAAFELAEGPGSVVRPDSITSAKGSGRYRVLCWKTFPTKRAGFSFLTEAEISGQGTYKQWGLNATIVDIRMIRKKKHWISFPANLSWSTTILQATENQDARIVCLRTLEARMVDMQQWSYCNGETVYFSLPRKVSCKIRTFVPLTKLSRYDILSFLLKGSLFNPILAEMRDVNIRKIHALSLQPGTSGLFVRLRNQ